MKRVRNWVQAGQELISMATTFFTPKRPKKSLNASTATLEIALKAINENKKKLKTYKIHLAKNPS